MAMRSWVNWNNVGNESALKPNLASFQISHLLSGGAYILKVLMKSSVFHPERVDLSLVSVISRNLLRPVHLTPSSPGMIDALVPRQDECVEEKILHSKMPNKRPVIPAGHSRTGADMSTSTLDLCLNETSAWLLRRSQDVWGGFRGQQGRKFSKGDWACPQASRENGRFDVCLISSLWSWRVSLMVYFLNHVYSVDFPSFRSFGKRGN